MKAIFRHIKYGPSELDDVYCLEEWSRCLKSYSSRPVDDSYGVPADINLIGNNPELMEYFDQISLQDRTSSYVEENPDAIFNKVFRNLAKCTFDIINSGKAKEPKYSFDLNQVLHGLQGRYASFLGLSQVLYVELFKFIQSSGFNSFEEFENEGISKFFSQWLNKYDEVAAEIIKENDMRRKMRMEQQNKSRVKNEPDNWDEDNKKVTQFASQNREVLQTTSLFGSSEDGSNTSSDSRHARLSEDELFISEEEEAEYWVNTPKRPVRTEAFEEKSLEKKLKLKLKSAEELKKTIDSLQNEIEKLESSLQVKKATIKPLLEQESILWDNIEELQRELR